MTQKEALEILKMGHNVFLTGKPGAGKTYLLNKYIEYLKKHKISVAITASTGIAATHIGGITIHSWSGIGVRKNLSPRQIDDLLDREYLVKRLNKAEVLIIDEISMIEATMLDDINNICRALRRKEEPFGGLQVVLVGDFFQLPPVNKEGGFSPAYESESWKSTKFAICYLSEQHRQSDEVLTKILGQIRDNCVSGDMHYELLRTTSQTFDDEIEPVRLFTHNTDVDRLNNERLAEINNEISNFTMTTKGKDKHVERLIKSCLSPEQLQLKEGAVVMCTKNNFEDGYVNGTMGKVIGFDSKTKFPTIETVDKKRLTITPTEWAFEDEGKVIASIQQIPLRLAWAITVHKSQGMSIDRAEIDLSQTFEYGQGYVALSRLKHIKGLRLLGLNKVALQVNPLVVKQDKRFNKLSDAAKDRLKTLPIDNVKNYHSGFIIKKGGSLKSNKEKEGDNPKTSSKEKTMNYLIQKETLEEISKKRKLGIETIVKHVEDLLSEGILKQKDIKHIKPTGKNFDKKLKEILSAFKKTGGTKLSPVKGLLGDKYSFEEIRFARLFL